MEGWAIIRVSSAYCRTKGVRTGNRGWWRELTLWARRIRHCRRSAIMIKKVWGDRVTLAKTVLAVDPLSGDTIEQDSSG